MTSKYNHTVHKMNGLMAIVKYHLWLVQYEMDVMARVHYH